MNSSIEKHVPTKTTTRRRKKPWINSKVKAATKKKKRAYLQTNGARSGPRWEEYKAAKKEAQRICRQSFNEHMYQTCNPGNKKKLYSWVKSQRTENSGITYLEVGGTRVILPKEKANALNRQFASVFTDSTPDPPLDIPSSFQTSDIQTINITEPGVFKLLATLDTSKAAGPDNIPARYLKLVAAQITPAVSLIFQASLEQGSLPSRWLTANVTPIFKKGKRTDPVNYRPISLTCICCKLLEHIVHHAVLGHYDHHGIISPRQHGFLKRRSCERQLITTLDDITANIQGKRCDLILLDFAKAFDKVSHDLLLTKLERYGVTGKVHTWIKAFLSGRSQRVVLENEESEACMVTSGVPQGSVLGPLLFLSYINDLPDSILHGSEVRLFADDTVLYRFITTREDEEKLQSDLDALATWEEKWKMQFNAQKCQVLHIGFLTDYSPPSYLLHGVELQRVKSASYLGVNIGDKLTWTIHVDSTRKKASRVLGFLRRNLHACNRSVKALAYRTYVLPILEYASQVWDPPTRGLQGKLERVQRNAAHFVTRQYDSDVNDNPLRWITVGGMYRFGTRVYIFMNPII